MEEIPKEWVEKVFNCMSLFYKDKWEKIIENPRNYAILNITWKNGLVGLSYEEIRRGLVICKRHSQDLGAHPPHVMEFFRYAKGTSLPYIDYTPAKFQRGNPEIAKKYLSQIKMKIGMPLQSRSL